MTRKSEKLMGLDWTEDDKWMEPMKGERWDTLVQKYNREFRAAVGAVPAGIVDKFEESYAEFRQPYFKGELEVTPGVANIFEWRSSQRSSVATHKAAAIDSRDDIIATVEEVSSEQYVCVVRRGGRRVWQSAEKVSATCEIIGDCVYYVAEGPILLWYNSVHCYSIAENRSYKMYEEKDQTCELTLERGANRCLFLLKNNFDTQWLYHVKGRSVTLLDKDSRFIPVGGAEASYFKQVGSDWKAVGAELKSIKWPHLDDCHISFIDLDARLIVVQEHGVRALYDCKGTTPKLLYKGIFSFDDYSHIWDGSAPAYKITEAGAAPRKISDIHHITKGRPYAKTWYHKTESADGTTVPFTVTSKADKPIGLIVIIYGAYNSPSNVKFAKWRPYLEAGWAVSIAMIRGGGDHTHAWSDAARTWKREKAVEDAEAVVKAARRVVGVMASQTCIYGRSAGGYIIGALVNRHPDATLFGAVYAEAPFVDILGTMSNLTLPAAMAESNEFGNPTIRIQDLETILRLSPVQNVPEGGVPKLFVVCRTSLVDIEVYAYESVKWMTRLKTGVLYVKKDGGHFTKTDELFVENAEDFVLLKKWLTKKSEV
jgi:hypothetical protein